MFRNTCNDDVKQMDMDHFIHPYTDFDSFLSEGSQIITSSKGVHVWDTEGKKYLDAIAGLWCVNVGHGREEIAKAVHDQVLQMAYYNPFGPSSNEPAARLSAKLCELAPDNLNHVFFSTGGSTANDSAIKIAHYYFNQIGQPTKRIIISRLDAYHGATYLSGSLTGIEGTKVGFHSQKDCIEHVSAANMYRRPSGMSEMEYCDFLVDEFEQKILALGPDNVAAFIAEPVMGAGGVLVAPEGYHGRIYDICKKYDLLYISDEVVTAFGRLGEMMASEKVFGIKPDIICVAKGVTSGYIPMGATLVSDEIYHALSNPTIEGSGFSMGYTYSGHPVAAAAALANIEIMEKEKICDHVKDVGIYFQSELAKLSGLPMVGDVRGHHLMAAVEFVSDKQTGASLPPESKITDRVFHTAREKGVIVRPVGNTIIMSPPLIFSKQDCAQVCDVLSEVIPQVADELCKEGYSISN